MNTKPTKWQDTQKVISSYTSNANEVTEALQDLYSIYDDNLYIWFARLYDKNIGGFYFSNSGRDNEPYLPDIESTAQATNALRSMGIVSSFDDYPEEMRMGISKFVCSLLDPEDGFIYHPQWGKNIVDSRRGRDLNWAIQLAKSFKFELPYKTANERLESALKHKNDDAVAIPEHLRSAEAMKKYLDKYDWENSPYYSGNNIASQMTSVVAAGLEDVVIDYLNGIQNPETGLWGNRSSYGAVNGLLKISAAYETANRPFHNAKAAARAAMECAIREDDFASNSRDERCSTVCHIYNTWFAVRNIVENLRKHGGENGIREAEEITREVYSLAPKAIRASKEKILRFKKPDGSFSYDLDMHLCGKSQEAPVCIPGTNEGSVNSTVISTTGLTYNIIRALGVSDADKPSIFGPEVRPDFIDALEL